MEEKTRSSFVRVRPSTRQKLKVLAAQRGMTMQDLIEQLVTQEIKWSEKKGEKGAQSI